MRNTRDGDGRRTATTAATTIGIINALNGKRKELPLIVGKLVAGVSAAVIAGAIYDKIAPQLEAQSRKDGENTAQA